MIATCHVICDVPRVVCCGSALMAVSLRWWCECDGGGVCGGGGGGVSVVVVVVVVVVVIVLVVVVV